MRAAWQLHAALALPGDELEAESRLTLIGEQLHTHAPQRARDPARRDPVLAGLRELLTLAMVCMACTRGAPQRWAASQPTWPESQ
ncbi:hypothetical protein STENM36S_05121 [Streptomyces tendae]